MDKKYLEPWEDPTHKDYDYYRELRRYSHDSKLVVISDSSSERCLNKAIKKLKSRARPDIVRLFFQEQKKSKRNNRGNDF